MSRSRALALLGFVLFLYVGTSVGHAVLDDAEALYASVAKQMLASGDFVTPYADGVRFLDKPPLMYWLMAAGYRVLGVDALAVRLPSIVAVAVISLLLAGCAARAGAPDAALAAGLMSASSAGMFLFTRQAFPDALLVAFEALAFASFLAWYWDDRGPRWPALAFFAALAGGVMTKGLIGLLFPLGTALLFLLVRRQLGRLRASHAGLGALVLLALVLPWHVWVARRNPGFLWHYVVEEHVLRFLNRREPHDYQSLPLWAFWALVPAWLFPWSAFLPAAAFGIRLRDLPARLRDLAALSWCWVAVVMGFFCFSSRIEHYALPVIPPLALLVALATRDRHPAEAPRLERWVRRGFAALAVVGGVGALALVASWRAPAAERMPSDAPSLYYFQPVFELPADVRATLEPALVAAALLLALGTLAAWGLERRGRRRPALLGLGATITGFCWLAAWSLGVCEPLLSSRQFAKALAGALQPGDLVVNGGDFETANSLAFYLPAPLYVVAGRAAVLEWGLKQPDAPRRILGEGEWHRLWSGEQRVYLLATDERLARLAPGPRHEVLRSAGRSLVCNQPVAADLRSPAAGPGS